MLRLAMEATLGALADAGIDPSEVEGFSSYTMDNVPEYEVARLLGCKNVKFFSQIPHGGGGACAPLMHAAMAVDWLRYGLWLLFLTALVQGERPRPGGLSAAVLGL